MHSSTKTKHEYFQNEQTIQNEQKIQNDQTIQKETKHLSKNKSMIIFQMKSRNSCKIKNTDSFKKESASNK
jgi:hypothetical protein